MYRRTRSCTALKRCPARTIINCIHGIQLQKEFFDGDTIPIEYSNLTDDGIEVLERGDLHIDDFQWMLCGRMMEIAQEVAGAVPGLGAARVAAIEQVLDDLIRRYPLPALEAFYDCYLAWDDAFRAALKADPGRIPDMAVACYGAVCYVSYAVNAGEGESAGVRVYCEGVEDEFNAVVAGLAQKEPLAIMMKERDLLDLTMRFSRSLAREMQLLGRR